MNKVKNFLKTKNSIIYVPLVSSSLFLITLYFTSDYRKDKIEVENITKETSSHIKDEKIAKIIGNIIFYSGKTEYVSYKVFNNILNQRDYIDPNYINDFDKYALGFILEMDNKSCLRTKEMQNASLIYVMNVLENYDSSTPNNIAIAIGLCQSLGCEQDKNVIEKKNLALKKWNDPWLQNVADEIYIGVPVPLRNIDISIPTK